jgi:peptidoglycan/xylan/chitin deacetylase (PgdA/CDA1 family)
MQQLTLHGYKAVIWSVDSMDWYTTNALEIQKCVLDKVHPGAIILGSIINVGVRKQEK